MRRPCLLCNIMRHPSGSSTYAFMNKFVYERHYWVPGVIKEVFDPLKGRSDQTQWTRMEQQLYIENQCKWRDDTRFRRRRRK